MPARPAWISRINEICEELERLSRPFINRSTLEVLLQVGRRRAQQILAPCVSDKVGANGLAEREAVIRRLRKMAAGEDEHFEVERRRKVADVIEKLRRERIESPQLLVEAPVRMLSQQLRKLPAGISIMPGRIIVEFTEPREALEKLFALAKAIGNDYELFERIALPRTQSS